MFSSRCLIEAVPGIGSMTGDLASSQAIATWAGWPAASLPCLHLGGSQYGAGAERVPGQEGDAELLAALEHALGFAVAEVVFVLHRDDVDQLARLLELGDVDVGQPDMADLAGALRVGERADRIHERHPDPAVQLVEVDALELQALQAAVDRALEVLERAVLVPARGGSAARGRLSWR